MCHPGYLLYPTCNLYLRICVTCFCGLAWLGKLLDLACDLAFVFGGRGTFHKCSFFFTGYGNCRWSNHSVGLRGPSRCMGCTTGLLDCYSMLSVYSVFCSRRT